MTISPKISLNKIQEWVDPKSFQRGQSYFHQDAIMDLRQENKRLPAFQDELNKAGF